MLKAVDLCKRVSTSETDLTILNQISFELEEGKSLAVVGESGSGKTTLLGLLAGLDKPTSGEVWLASKSIFSMSEEQRALSRKENLGFIFQIGSVKFSAPINSIGFLSPLTFSP